MAGSYSSTGISYLSEPPFELLVRGNETNQAFKFLDEITHAHDTVNITGIITEKDTTKGGKGTHHISLEGDGCLHSRGVGEGIWSYSVTHGDRAAGSTSHRAHRCMDVRKREVDERDNLSSDGQERTGGRMEDGKLTTKREHGEREK